jgi:glycosyltransferase involved in cell wall biosynthesis
VKPPTLSICVPAYNEEGNLAPLHDAVLRAVNTAGITAELILVDDGSRDGTWREISQLASADPALVRGLRLARNCGETAACDAALRAARGDYVMTMDADLQNDPADIPAFLAAIRMPDVDCVCGTRVATRGEGDNFIRVASSRVANWVRNRLSDESISARIDVSAATAWRNSSSTAGCTGSSRLC